MSDHPKKSLLPEKIKKKVLISLLLCLVPILIGFLLWNHLDEQIPVHFNMNGEVDGYASKSFAILFIPLFCLACNAFCLWATLSSPKRGSIGSKMMNLLFWLIPAIELVVMALLYLAALTEPIPFTVSLWIGTLLGVLFMVLGNRMPKVSQNYVVGVRTPWTLDNPEIWTKTNRMAGRWMFVFGLIGLILAWIPGFAEISLFSWVVCALVLSIGSMAYSWYLYRHLPAGQKNS